MLCARVPSMNTKKNDKFYHICACTSNLMSARARLLRAPAKAIATLGGSHSGPQTQAKLKSRIPDPSLLIPKTRHQRGAFHQRAPIQNMYYSILRTMCLKLVFAFGALRICSIVILRASELASELSHSGLIPVSRGRPQYLPNSCDVTATTTTTTAGIIDRDTASRARARTIPVRTHEFKSNLITYPPRAQKFAYILPRHIIC